MASGPGRSKLWDLIVSLEAYSKFRLILVDNRSRTREEQIGCCQPFFRCSIILITDSEIKGFAEIRLFFHERSPIFHTDENKSAFSPTLFQALLCRYTSCPRTQSYIKETPLSH
jgi:hypothetical protein